MQDSFYRGLNTEELKRVHEYNFDHPGILILCGLLILPSSVILDGIVLIVHWFFVCVDAFDTEQLLDCIQKLRSGHSVQVPIYDFKYHRQSSDSFRQVVSSFIVELCLMMLEKARCIQLRTCNSCFGCLFLF